MRRLRPCPPQSDLQDLFDYRDGGLYWKKKPSPLANNIKIGARAGRQTQAYRQIRIHNIRYVEHRLIWSWHHGPIPEGMVVDHINDCKADNRIENLQLLTDRENVAKNRTKPGRLSNATPRGRGWAAQAFVDGKVRYVGIFDTQEEAHAAAQDFVKKS